MSDAARRLAEKAADRDIMVVCGSGRRRCLTSMKGSRHPRYTPDTRRTFLIPITMSWYVDGFGRCSLSLSLTVLWYKDWGVVCDDATYCGTPHAAQLVPTQLSVRVDRWPSCVRCEGVNWLNNETESVRGEEKYSELYLCKLLSLPPMSALVECRYSMLLLYE